MGLDMYLSKRVYVGANYDHNNVKGNIEITSGKKHKEIKVNPTRVSEIIEQVAYWRKSNAVHSWFVENIQDGNDDCGEYYVSDKQLKKLIETCRTTIEIVGKSPKKFKTAIDWDKKEYQYEVYDVDEKTIQLQTKEGFFFGGTDYTEHYLEDLKDTISQLEPLLIEEGSFYYSSSW